MSTIVDRRKNGNKKSLDNRQRFLKRARKNIKKQVDEIVQQRNIKDIDSGDKITIPQKGIAEPNFGNGKGGNRDFILPGNKDKIVGDSIKKPEGGDGQGRNGSQDGEGEDEFSFNLTREEFLDFFFEDLELPDLIKTQLKDQDIFKLKRVGFSPVGNPSNLNIVRSMQAALGRQIALQSPYEKEIKELEEKRKKANTKRENDEIDIALLLANKERDLVPFIDDIDLRYNNFEKKPTPSTQAVMICMMDVSGSMGEYEKDLAKRFFMLLYLFLGRKYEKVDVVFIRHHHTAAEVDEQEFFYSKESGGTVVSTAMELADEIITKRYPTSDYNIYFAQASDGDNYSGDTVKVLNLLTKNIFPKIQYYAYVEVGHDPGYWKSYYEAGKSDSELWKQYETLGENRFHMRKIDTPKDIYPIFRDLFSRNKLDEN